MRQYVTGRILSASIDLFYPIAPDVLRVITAYCGIPRDKCQLSSLAVDTDVFSPRMDPEDIRAFRKKMGYGDDDIVCLYTGRFTEAKGPLLLAQAVQHLQETGHERFKGFFVGQGDTGYQDAIAQAKGCAAHPFVEAHELPRFYNSFDIGVWPLQESTSQLDAAACGMPIIINEKVEDHLRTEGNGLRYKDRDFKDLAAKILLLQDKAHRRSMGKIGSEKVAALYSWDHVAQDRIKDFKDYVS
jgi:glycosyltransferase involved in cell wall biosynthesis